MRRRAVSAANQVLAAGAQASEEVVRVSVGDVPALAASRASVAAVIVMVVHGKCFRRRVRLAIRHAKFRFVRAAIVRCIAGIVLALRKGPLQIRADVGMIGGEISLSERVCSDLCFPSHPLKTNALMN